MRRTNLAIERPPLSADIEALGRGDPVKVDCTACHHVALLRPEALSWLGPSAKARPQYFLTLFLNPIQVTANIGKHATALSSCV